MHFEKVCVPNDWNWGDEVRHLFCSCCLCTLCYAMVYVRITVGRYSAKYANHKQYIDKYWTSFWSPIRSIGESTTNNNICYAWNCLPHLCYAPSPNHKQKTCNEKVTTLQMDKYWKQMSLENDVAISEKKRPRQAWHDASGAWGYQNIHRYNPSKYICHLYRTY